MSFFLNKGSNFSKLQLNKNIDPSSITELTKKEYTVFKIKAAFSFLLVISGIIFMILGLRYEGTIDLTISTVHLSMNKVIPGIIFTLFGVIVLLFSRINIRIK